MRRLARGAELVRSLLDKIRDGVRLGEHREVAGSQYKRLRPQLLRGSLLEVEEEHVVVLSDDEPGRLSSRR